MPKKGFAQLAVEAKKTLVIADPLTSTDYDPSIDLSPLPSSLKALICLPVMDRDKL